MNRGENTDANLRKLTETLVKSIRNTSGNAAPTLLQSFVSS